MNMLINHFIIASRAYSQQVDLWSSFFQLADQPIACRSSSDRRWVPDVIMVVFTDCRMCDWISGLDGILSCTSTNLIPRRFKWVCHEAPIFVDTTGHVDDYDFHGAGQRQEMSRRLWLDDHCWQLQSFGCEEYIPSQTVVRALMHVMIFLSIPHMCMWA